MLKYDSIAELVNEAEKRGLKLSELVLKTQAAMTEKTEEEMFATMERSLQVMKESVQDGLDKDKRSASGLTGGDAYKLNEALKAGKNIAGHFFGNAMMKAVAVAQTNACMGRIVASPTAGSCGILPSALLTLQEEKNISDKDLVMALFTASAVGIVIATNASVAGASGGMRRGKRNGGGGNGRALRRHTQAVRARLCNRAEKYSRSGLRPCCRSG